MFCMEYDHDPPVYAKIALSGIQNEYDIMNILGIA